MSDVFKKLNLRDQEEILVLNAPESFEPELALLDDVAIRRSIDSLQRIAFSLAFVTKQAEVDNQARAIAHRADGDYTCEFNRDTGWALQPTRLRRAAELSGGLMGRNDEVHLCSRMRTRPV